MKLFLSFIQNLFAVPVSYCISTFNDVSNYSSDLFTLFLEFQNMAQRAFLETKLTLILFFSINGKFFNKRR